MCISLSVHLGTQGTCAMCVYLNKLQRYTYAHILNNVMAFACFVFQKTVVASSRRLFSACGRATMATETHTHIRTRDLLLFYAQHAINMSEATHAKGKRKRLAHRTSALACTHAELIVKLGHEYCTIYTYECKRLAGVCLCVCTHARGLGQSTSQTSYIRDCASI